MATTALYRTFLREAKQMSDYNFRNYAIRRVKTGFRKNVALQGDEASVALQQAQQQLELLRRQAVLGKLYPSARSVMESPTAVV
eukprot:CAMPEP_0117078166 /NCGR_PEP_ID=MMETSP0472-20121206/55119_1 /TAXON_ID=693140 ORGANISM="Tiarina fusus, Strain LIS" /NCGR_SAMPLE_ID=MMETSP0472 /ASSEMBLY_ACC=CAM_ASM_000603 /LENGTH=83 /DNA_ID=CAMNT_0004804809 /DNA_START=95 /DNA_END=346 /DNA_ORIENTATION=+